MSVSRRFGLLCVLPLLACGGDSNKDTDNGGGAATEGEPGGQAGDLSIRFSPMYSAYDGMHDFKLPVVVQSVDSKGNVTTLKDVTFSASDKAKVDVENGPDGATLTMKAAGDVTITASKGSLKGTAKLHITQATPEQWQAGADRYNNEIDALPGAGSGMITGFMPPNFEGACTTCHGQTAKLLKVMHTPQQTGGYSDEELTTLFTMGEKPEGYAQRTGIPECLWGMGHKWKMSAEQEQGMVVYLRSIAPQTQGAFDFPMPNLGDGGLRFPTGAGGLGGGLPMIPVDLCNLFGDGGLLSGILRDGGLAGLFGEGGIPNIPGLGGPRDAGVPSP